MTCSSTGAETRILDIREIAERLFERNEIRKRICRNFALKDVGEPMVMAKSWSNRSVRFGRKVKAKRRVAGTDPRSFVPLRWRWPATCGNGRDF